MEEVEEIKELQAGELPSVYEDECNFRIQVTSPAIEQQGAKSYAVYKVCGRDATGEFNVNRRYKEFVTLRSLLVQAWPGCVFMLLPPKKYRNLDASVLETRQKLLDTFTKKCAAKNWVYESDLFQHFLRAPEDFSKLMGKFPSPSYAELASVYQSVFAVNTESTELQLHTIDTGVAELKETLALLEDFEYKVIMAEHDFKSLAIVGKTALEQAIDLSEHYKNTLDTPKITIRKKSEYKNPFSLLVHWTKVEISVIRGLFEVIKQREKFEKAKTKLEAKLQSGQATPRNFAKAS